MPRRALALIPLVFIGCLGESLAPNPMPGEYDLLTIDGQAPPTQFVRDSLCAGTVTSGAMTIGQNTVNLRVLVTKTCDAGQPAIPMGYVGVLSGSAPNYYIAYAPDASSAAWSDTMVVSGGTVTMRRRVGRQNPAQPRIYVLQKR